MLLARHQANAERLWLGLEQLGIQLYVPSPYRLPTLTTVRVPAEVNEADLRHRLLETYNIEIAGGLGVLEGKVLRIGLMEYSSQLENVVLLLGAMKEIPKPSVRGEKRDDLHEDHIRTARAKGLREQVVI